jgi:hypothetical protein
MRLSLSIGIPIVLIIILVVGVVVMDTRKREGVTNRKSDDPEYSPRMGLPETKGTLGHLPSQKEEKKMFPGVPWGNEQATQSMMPGPTKVPSAPSAMLEQLLGYMQPLGSAPDESIGTGTPVDAKGAGAAMGADAAVARSAERAARGAAGMMPVHQGEAGFQPDAYGSARGGESGRGEHHASPQSALPKGIPKSKIPKGQEDLYILKTEIVPPVCPACPACPECPRPVCPKPDDSQCPPCPAPGRCPPSSFGCQRVPLYQNMNSGVLPAYMN